MVYGVGGLLKKWNWVVGRRKYFVSFCSCYYLYNGGMIVLYVVDKFGRFYILCFVWVF